jgi:hypothetical protein
MGIAANGPGALVLVLSATLLRGLLVGVSPTPGDTLSGPPVPFATVAQGTASGVHAPIQMTIRDTKNWERLWNQLMAPGHRLPAVDFGRDMIIAVSSGPTPEPSVLTITRVTRLRDRLAVVYTLSRPRPLPEGGNAGISAPFHVVRLARSRLPVDFVFFKTPPLLWSPNAPAQETKKG